MCAFYYLILLYQDRNKSIPNSQSSFQTSCPISHQQNNLKKIYILDATSVSRTLCVMMCISKLTFWLSNAIIVNGVCETNGICIALILSNWFTAGLMLSFKRTRKACRTSCLHKFDCKKQQLAETPGTLLSLQQNTINLLLRHKNICHWFEPSLDLL